MPNSHKCSDNLKKLVKYPIVKSIIKPIAPKINKKAPKYDMKLRIFFMFFYHIDKLVQI